MTTESGVIASLALNLWYWVVPMGVPMVLVVGTIWELVAMWRAWSYVYEDGNTDAEIRSGLYISNQAKYDLLTYYTGQAILYTVSNFSGNSHDTLITTLEDLAGWDDWEEEEEDQEVELPDDQDNDANCTTDADGNFVCGL